MHQKDKKRAAALAALEYIEEGCLLGVGTGSTVNYFIDALPEIRHKISALVASSEATRERLEGHGFEVSDLSETGDLDLYVDGADEANKHFHLIKGGGGALTREKVLAGASRKFVCIIDDSKMVGTLGSFPLPIEVIPMARYFVSRRTIKYRGQPVWRDSFISDNGNEIVDVYNLQITNPVEMEERLSLIPGVVTVGLFAHRGADILIIADDREVRTIKK